MVEFLDELNEPQRQAVTMPLMNGLVLAGAGSGKTRVLVHRIAWLVEQERLSPHAILAVTFTNKAAGEMRHRLEHLLNYSVQSMWVGTFHGIAHKLLRRHYEASGLPQNFQILDSDDQLRMVKRVLKSLNIDEDRWPPKKVQWFINGKKDEGLRAAHLDDNNDPYLITLKKVYIAYEDACERAGVVDFAELLLRAHELFLKDQALLAHYQERFKAILVDEFQDTNTIQYAWIRLLSSSGIPVMVVGDDDQSIYGWRGAKIENIHRFKRDYHNTETIFLEQNYRSSGNILKAANHLISHNDSRLGKSLWTDDADGEPIYIYAAYNEIDEARFVISRIEKCLNEGYAKSDIAILYRSNAQSRTLEDNFLKSDIPYRIYGGLRFFERAEIKDVLAYCRLVAGRDDDSAFERVVNFPTRGLGEKTLQVLREFAREKGIPLWQAALSVLDDKDLLTSRAKSALKAFIDLIDNMDEDTKLKPLDELVNHVIHQSGLYLHYSTSKNEKAQSRVENIQELVSAAKQFELDSDVDEDISMLNAFLSHASLEAGDAQANDNEACVQLMTMHSAKGLEFKVVFIVGMEEGIFPARQSIEEIGRLEEERRLCYVGMTRAREMLILTHAEVRRLYGREEYHRPSRFVKELPVELIEEIRMTSVKTPVMRPKRIKSKTLVQEASHGLALGQSVSHKKFGQGTVLNFEGSGNHARVQVKFHNDGVKWLVINYANLTPTA